ncbi:MAG: hypothetical protein WCN87_02130, partial [Chlamydiota bacterium]
MSIFFSFFLSISFLGCTDLEEHSSSFVIETKKIDIPGYSYAFNASIIPFQEAYLLSFRTGSYQDAADSVFIQNVLPGSRPRKTDEIGLVFLNKNMEAEGPVHILDIHHHHGLRAFRQQDPRLVEVGGRVYIVYSNMIERREDPIRRVFVAELFYDGAQFTAGSPEYLAHFEGAGNRRVEKNWVPFDFEGKLLLSYSLVPHIVFAPLWGSSACTTVAKTAATISWNYGEPRGGTPAILDQGQYIAFFHSSKMMASKQSGCQKMLHYFMGAYTYLAEDPFSLTAISPSPILAKSFYSGTMYNTWKPLRVIFPCGLVADKNFFWVTYGRQGH